MDSWFQKLALLICVHVKSRTDFAALLYRVVVRIDNTLYQCLGFDPAFMFCETFVTLSVRKMRCFVCFALKSDGRLLKSVQDHLQTPCFPTGNPTWYPSPRSSRQLITQRAGASTCRLTEESMTDAYLNCDQFWLKISGKSFGTWFTKQQPTACFV